MKYTCHLLNMILLIYIYIYIIVNIKQEQQRSKHTMLVTVPQLKQDLVIMY
jgi:hypothetical protein